MVKNQIRHLWVIVIILFMPLKLWSADLCFCPEKPIGSECNGKCFGNPGGVVVVLPNEPKEPGVNPFAMPKLWSKPKLEIFRKNNEQLRSLLEEKRSDAERERMNSGKYPPSDSYKNEILEYSKGIERYKFNMKQYKELQRKVK